jgi:hypothetical protein
MTPIARLSGWVIGVSAAAVLALPAAATARPDPFEPPAPDSHVNQVPVPVPVGDSADEAIQMGIAAVLGAAAAVAAGAATRRLRRTHQPRTSIIDLTHSAQS